MRYGDRDEIIALEHQVSKYRAEAHLLTHERDEALAEIERHHGLIVRLKDIIERKDKLLACYRTGSRPSGRLLDELFRDREFLNREIG